MHADGPCPRQSNASRPARLGHRIGSVRARSIAGTADDSVKLDGHIQPHAYGSHKPSCGVRHEYIHAWLIPGLRSAATRRSQPAQQAHDSKAVDVRRAGMHEGSGARVAICAHREARERAQWSHDRLLTYIRGTARIVDRPASHASARLSLQRMLRRLSSFSLGIRSFEAATSCGRRGLHLARCISMIMNQGVIELRVTALHCRCMALAWDDSRAAITEEHRVSVMHACSTLSVYSGYQCCTGP